MLLDNGYCSLLTYGAEAPERKIWMGSIPWALFRNSAKAKHDMEPKLTGTTGEVLNSRCLKQQIYIHLHKFEKNWKLCAVREKMLRFHSFSQWCQKGNGYNRCALHMFLSWFLYYHVMTHLWPNRAKGFSLRTGNNTVTTSSTTCCILWWKGSLARDSLPGNRTEYTAWKEEAVTAVTAT